MISELSFLLDLLLEHELNTDIKKLISNRIKEIEGSYSKTINNGYIRPIKDSNIQSPSTQAILARDAVVPPQVQDGVNLPAPPVPTPSGPVATNTITANALADRARLMNAAISGKGGSSAPKLGIGTR